MMPAPQLTILLWDVFELEHEYLRMYFRALSEWNPDGLADTQIILISQKADATEAHSICSKLIGCPVDIVHANHEFVAGYPVWDIMATVRAVWPLVRGRYVTFHHPEFIWGPGRLRKTNEWLAKNSFYYVMGNLRRPGSIAEITNQRTQDHCSIEISQQFVKLFSNGNLEAAKIFFETMPNCHWMFWCMQEQRPGPNAYIEDIFFADKEWLDSWRFYDHGGELPFQDVFDLIGQAVRSVLMRHAVSVECYRMPMDVNKHIHLWHPKTWGSWTPQLRDWFLNHPERWKGTKFMDRVCWEGLIRIRGVMPKTYQPVNELRNAVGGTATRFVEGLNKWLMEGGVKQVSEFYARHGRNGRQA